MGHFRNKRAEDVLDPRRADVDLRNQCPQLVLDLERDDFSSNRHPALSFCLSMIFSENRYPLFRIMLQGAGARRPLCYNTICVCVTMATSLPSSVSSRVCQTWVRRPRCTGVAVAITVIPSLAPPMKLVLLSIVVVPLASPGKLITVAAAPTESANAITAPP